MSDDFNELLREKLENEEMLERSDPHSAADYRERCSCVAEELKAIAEMMQEEGIRRWPDEFDKLVKYLETGLLG